MINWIIKMLGGFTRDEFFKLLRALGDANHKLIKARKNDTPRDPKTGRFTKK